MEEKIKIHREHRAKKVSMYEEILLKNYGQVKTKKILKEVKEPWTLDWKTFKKIRAYKPKNSLNASPFFQRNERREKIV